MIVFDRLFSTGQFQSYFRFFRSDDGHYATIQGRCGSGGKATATCARVGHADFRVRVRDAVFAPTILMLGVDRTSASCGSCPLVIDPTRALLQSTVTSLRGHAEAKLPLPNDSAIRGLQVLARWLVFPRSGAACTQLGAHFSDAIQITIQ